VSCWNKTHLICNRASATAFVASTALAAAAAAVVCKWHISMHVITRAVLSQQATVWKACYWQQQMFGSQSADIHKQANTACIALCHICIDIMVYIILYI
jgi:hypothetical protein